jgi:hypothetical protein
VLADTEGEPQTLRERKKQTEAYIVSVQGRQNHEDKSDRNQPYVELSQCRLFLLWVNVNLGARWQRCFRANCDFHWDLWVLFQVLLKSGAHGEWAHNLDFNDKLGIEIGIEMQVGMEQASPHDDSPNAI